MGDGNWQCIKKTLGEHWGREPRIERESIKGALRKQVPVVSERWGFIPLGAPGDSVELVNDSVPWGHGTWHPFTHTSPALFKACSQGSRI